MTNKPMRVSRDRLRELLHYCPDTGRFTWLKRRSNVPAGALAGSCGSSHGYREIRIDGVNYLEHRLAWFYVQGVWPDQIDHANLDRTDNRIVNLRCATFSQNNNNRGARRDNESGFKGVYRPAGRRKWTAQAKISGQKTYLGTYDTPELAHDAYCRAGRAAFGEFFHD